MKKLFYKLSYYIVIIFFIYFIFSIIMKHIMNKNKFYEIGKEKTVLILGDSHAAAAINDSLYANYFNLSKPAETYVFIYAKLKKILPLNPQIKTVILACAEHNIQQRKENILWDEGFMNENIKINFNMLSSKELFLLFANNPAKSIASIFSLPKTQIQRYIQYASSDKPFLLQFGFGGYLGLRGQKNNWNEINWNETKKPLGAKESANYSKTSFVQVSYLHKIVDFCKSHNVKIVFLRTPEYKLYVKGNEQEYFNLLQSQFSDIPLMDYANISLPDSFFYDFDHLNNNGAKVITNAIAASGY